MNYLLKSVQPLASWVFPVLLGDTSTETAAIRQQMLEAFGEDGFILDRVPHSSLGSYYRAADLFILCSPKESFGLASVEALYHGLPVICDDFPEVRFVLDDKAVFVAMRSEEILTTTIMDVLSHPANAVEVKEKVSFVQSRYTWQSLQNAYISLFKLLEGQ